MRGLADVILVYTDTEAAELLRVIPNKSVIALHNALYFKREMEPARNGQTPTDFIYVGRLVAEKKPELLLSAYATVVKKLPPTCNLVFIGSGPVRDGLVQKTAELGLSDRVRFTGHISDGALLREYYGRAIVSVSPGYVGLSLIQSLGFGVPMIIADDEPHAPEVEAVREDENARFFTANSVQSLARELMRFTDEGQYWYEKREEISKFCRDRYSSEAMATAFISAINGPRSDPGEGATLAGGDNEH
jgi:glycosyltransferase involved in cell wall biosynthesis